MLFEVETKEKAKCNNGCRDSGGVTGGKGKFAWRRCADRLPPFLVSHGVRPWTSDQIFNAKIGIICGIVVAVIAYMVVLVLFKALNEDDFDNIPKGKKLYFWAKKFKIM
jgi:hypothetical protein